jgi:hypothetical protein
MANLITNFIFIWAEDYVLSLGRIHAEVHGTSLESVRNNSNRLDKQKLNKMACFLTICELCLFKEIWPYQKILLSRDSYKILPALLIII